MTSETSDGLMSGLLCLPAVHWPAMRLARIGLLLGAIMVTRGGLNPVRALCGLVGLVIAAAASAQNYPARAVTLIVPFSAGGPTDTIGRIMAERMGRSLGQTVVVENTTGAGGSIGVGRVARAAPDGYALGIGHIGTHVINAAVYQLPFDVLKDLEPVAMIATNPQVII